MISFLAYIFIINLDILKVKKNNTIVSNIFIVNFYNEKIKSVIKVEYIEVLRSIREKNSLTQEDVSSILNIDRRTYNHYEIGEKILPIKHLIKLSDYLNYSVDYILGLTILKQYNSVKNANKEISGQRLREFRKENKLTQVKLADILNTTFSSIAFNEKGRNFIATPFLYTICKKYHISADYLLGKIDEPKYLDK